MNDHDAYTCTTDDVNPMLKDSDASLAVLEIDELDAVAAGYHAGGGWTVT